MRGLSQGQSPARDSFISWGGHYWKRVTVVCDFHHLSNQLPIRAEILGAQRKLVIVISHLGPTRHRGAEGHFFLGCSMRAGRIRGRLCALVASSSCETGARFMVTLQRFFQPTSLVFISLVDKSGREAQLRILWSHQRATLGTFSRSVMPIIIAVSSLPFNLIREEFIKGKQSVL